MHIVYHSTKLSLFLRSIDEFVGRSESPLLEYFAQLGIDQHFRPSDVKAFFDDLRALHGRLTKTLDLAQKQGLCTRNWDDDISDADASLLRQVMQSARLVIAEKVGKWSDQTFDGELLDSIASQLLPYSQVTEEEWFRAANKRRVPRLTDFAPLKFVAASELQPAEREYDEKFHILQAQSSFIPDLDAYRWTGEFRDISFAVAFVDIDNFKAFNSEHTETIVDREVLPTFMRCVEAHLYKRGYAYRIGGDEYMVLLYNTSQVEAVRFVDELREKVERLTYRQIERQLTVSMGLVCGEGDCYFTSWELGAKANKAKEFAKKSGRNCIATYRTAALDENELHVAAPDGKVSC